MSQPQEHDLSDRAPVDIRSRLAAIVDSSNDAIISKNLDGVISTWNLAAHRLFGYSEAEAVGQPITIIIPADLHDEEKEILRRVRSGERIDHYETRRVTQDGRILDVSITISPVRNAAGAIVGASKILRDVTESKRDRAALRESERRLASEVTAARTLQSISTRLISESIQQSLFGQILDAAMELMSSDASTLQMLAPDGESLTLIGAKNFHPDSAAFWQRVTADAGSTCGVALRDNLRVMVTDVDACAFMAGSQDLEEYRRSGIRAVQSTPLRSRVGRPLGMISTHWQRPHAPTEDDFRLFDVLARQAADLIERTRAEEELRESEERFRLIANTAPVIIWMSDVNKDCTYVNQTWLDLTGQSFDGVLGNGWTDRIHPADVGQCRDSYARAFERRELFQIDFRLRRHDDEYRWIVGTGTPRYHGDGSFAGYIGSALDVTERRLAAEALATIHQQLIDAHEDERSRIARELHDDISQRLAVLTISLDALGRTSAAPGSDGRPAIEEARDEVMNLARDVQALSHRLHPSRLELLGITKAAAALCREISSLRALEIRFNAESVPDGLSRRVAMCLYRVLQEALQNAIKHSGVGKMEVSLRGGVDQIELTVRDFGAGFDVSTTGRGLGLTSMEERVRAVRGRLAILSEPQRGTTIHASVPLVWDDPKAPSQLLTV
ncbi:MAG TPA: PAS domain S-box protein [Vicinamibacterales bacterium]|nr:PAS domain S-box protein [Vicinamibacterales bacterium]